MSHERPILSSPSAKKLKSSHLDSPASLPKLFSPPSPNTHLNGTGAHANGNGSKAPFVTPSDWPKDGPIDLSTADLPHDSADTEWWYINGHVNAQNGQEFSFFASFFRIVKQVDSAGKLTHAHALNWAIVDVNNKQYHADPILDKATPEILRKQLKDGTYDIDQRISRAFMEIVKKEHVPLPDRMFTGPVVVAKDKLNLNFDGNLYYKKDNGNYYLRCANAIKGMAFELELTPQKIPIRQAHNGVVKIGLKQDTMFYYYIPRNNCVGSITVNSQTHNVTGSAWYDHEFGGEIKASKRVQTPSTPPTHMNGNGHAMHDEDSSEDEKGITVTTETKEKVSYAWNWLSVQLDDGSDITATTLVDTIKQNIEDNFAIVTGPAPQCERVEYPEMSLTAKESWSSIRTTNEYPTLWHFTIPAAQIDLEVRSVFDNQEFITLISKPAFWEGRVNVKGTYRGRNVTGKGFIERHGFQSMNNLDTFFKRISKQVMNTIENIIPLKPTYSQARDLIASSEFDHFMDGVNVEVYRKTVIEPLREIVDRGGKSWRSFAFLLCMDCVGGNSLDYKHWLAMPEVMHVGSLIVDDIQDKSETRRGGPSCHMVHGDAIAINAGTAAYFLSLQILQELTPGLTPLLRNRLYEMYILTLRSGHAGQAFDIYGLDYLMDEAVKGGDSTRLEKSVLATHRLKSAVPAGNLARMGATVGGGSTDQIEKLGMYMESIGLAFQIIDDVLNLRGFQGNVKDRGEDITAGKVTFPVAKSMSSSRCDLTQRQNIWNTVKSKPSDKAVIQDVIQQLETCGALDASVDEANRLVKTAWQEVDACIPDSFYKMLLRAFGWYVLERHY